MAGTDSGAVDFIRQMMSPISVGTSDASRRINNRIDAPTGYIPMNPLDNSPTHVTDLPEYIRGQYFSPEKYLVTEMTRTSEVYTTIMLPWVYADQTAIELDRWEFCKTLAGKVPHRGVSRLVESERRSYKGHSVRRGLAFIMEADALGTPKGQRQFVRNVVGIRSCIQETQNYDTLFALITCKDNERIWNEQYGRIQGFSFSTIVKTEAQDFARIAFAEDERALELIYHTRRKALEDRGVRPNLFLISHGAAMYLTLAEPKKTYYYMAGDEGKMIRQEGPDAIASLLPKTAVFEARNFDIEKEAPPLNLLARQVRVAETTTMTYEDLKNTKSSLFTFKTEQRDTYIANTNKDNYERLKFKESFTHAQLFDNNGRYAPKLEEWVENYHEQPSTKKKKVPRKNMGTKGNPDFGNDNMVELPPSPFSYQKDGRWHMAKYWIQIDSNSIGFDDDIAVGTTLAGKICSEEHSYQYREQYRKVLKLLQKIGTTPYNEAFFLELIKANVANSINREGEFVGELTPIELSQDKGLPRIREWKPNSNGSLTLPPMTIEGLIYPPGFDNYYGLKVLAAEANKRNSPWSKGGKEASEAIEFIENMADTFFKVFPESLVFNTGHRPSWFHQADRYATFFDDVIAVPRDPLFLAFLESINEDERLSLKEGKGAEEPKKKNFKSEMISIRELLKDSKVGGEPLFEEIKMTLKAFFDNVTKKEFFTLEATNVIIGGLRSIGAVALLPRWIQIYFFLGEKSKDVYNKIIYTLWSNKSFSDLKKLGEFLIRFTTHQGKESLRKLVIGLGVSAEFSGGSAEKDFKPTKESFDALTNIITEITQTTKKKSEKGKPSAAAIVKNLIEYGEEVEGDIELTLAPLSDYPSLSKELNEKILKSAKETSALQTAFENAIYVYASFQIDHPQLPPFIVTNNPDVYTQLAAKVKDIEVEGNPEESLNALAVSLKKFPNLSEEDWDLKISELEERWESKSKMLEVGYTSEAIKQARFFRAPLTMSAELATSLLKKKNPLVRISDPHLGHTSFWNPEQDKEELPPSIWKRTQYTIIGSASPKSIEDFNFAANYKAPPKSAASQIKKSAPEFDPMNVDPISIFSGLEKGGFKSQIGTHLSKKTKEDEMFEPQSMDRLPFGKPSHKFGETGIGAQFKIPSAIEKFNNAHKEPDYLIRAATLVYLTSPCDKYTAIESMMNHDVLVPINLVAWRFPELLVSTWILMLAGLATGANLYGYPNWATSEDTITKTLNSNFTWYSKAFVWDPKNVELIQDVKPEKYLGGSNMAFMKNTMDFHARGENRPSIIVTAVCAAEVLPEIISFVGYVPYALRSEPTSREELHYSTSGYYNELWEFSKIISSRMILNERFTDPVDRFVFLGFQGTQINWNPLTRQFNKPIPCKGHRKADGCGPGTLRVWNGDARVFKPQQFEHLNL